MGRSMASIANISIAFGELWRDRIMGTSIGSVVVVMPRTANGISFDNLNRLPRVMAWVINSNAIGIYIVKVFLLVSMKMRKVMAVKIMERLKSVFPDTSLFRK